MAYNIQPNRQLDITDKYESLFDFDIPNKKSICNYILLAKKPPSGRTLLLAPAEG